MSKKLLCDSGASIDWIMSRRATNHSHLADAAGVSESTLRRMLDPMNDAKIESVARVVFAMSKMRPLDIEETRMLENSLHVSIVELNEAYKAAKAQEREEAAAPVKLPAPPPAPAAPAPPEPQAPADVQAATLAELRKQNELLAEMDRKSHPGGCLRWAILIGIAVVIAIVLAGGFKVPTGH